MEKINFKFNKKKYTKKISRTSMSHWIKIFPLITPFVINHFIKRDCEYILDLMATKLTDPKKLCGMFGIQFGETMRKFKLYDLTESKDLYNLVTTSNFFEEKRKYRCLLSDFYARINIKKKNKPVKKVESKIEIDIDKFIANQKKRKSVPS
jgi:hypothetical protein